MSMFNLTGAKWLSKNPVWFSAEPGNGKGHYVSHYHNQIKRERVAPSNCYRSFLLVTFPLNSCFKNYAHWAAKSLSLMAVCSAKLVRLDAAKMKLVLEEITPFLKVLLQASRVITH